MKRLLPLLAAALAGLAVSLHAAPPVDPPDRRNFKKLTAEEQDQYKQAYNLALTDPAVAAAAEDRNAVQQQWREVRDAAVLKHDPSLSGILNIAEASHGASGGSNRGVLSADERKLVAAAINAVRKDPEIRKAQEKVNTANAAYRAALVAAMLKHDAGLGPVFEKLGYKAPGAPAVTPAAPGQK